MQGCCRQCQRRENFIKGNEQCKQRLPRGDWYYLRCCGYHAFNHMKTNNGYQTWCGKLCPISREHHGKTWQKKESDKCGKANREFVGNNTVPITSKQINKILSFVEIALVLSQADKKQAVEDVLTHAAAIIEKILDTDRRSIRRQPTNIVSKRLKTENG